MGLGNGLRLTWVGHATWIMETPGGKRVLIDPWVTGNPVVPDELKDPGPFDVLLLTHGHNDHTGDAVDLATRHAPKAVLAMIELGDYLEGKGVENVIGYNKGGTAEAEGLKFTMVDARHSSSFTEPDGTILHTGDPNGYIVTLEDGRRVYVAGDTCVFGDMALIGRLYKPDVAILPIGDFFTMGPFEAAEAIRMLGVKKVVPTHYGTFPRAARDARPAAPGGGRRVRAGGARRGSGRHGRMTFSLVACDLEARQWGVAVASKFPCVGAVVPWVRGDVGAIATQAAANVSYGPDGLRALAAGSSAQAALDGADRSGRGNRRAAARHRRRAGRQRDAYRARTAWTGPAVEPARALPPRATSWPARRWSTRWSTPLPRPADRWPTGWRPRCLPPTGPAATGAGARRRRWSCARPAPGTGGTTTS